MLSSQIHKRINFNFEGQKLIFDTSRILFSSAQVDEGTKELLNSLRKNKEINPKKILDLGCGYGVIGIFLKKLFPDSEVLCADRDSLAVELTKHNAKLNDAKIKAISSLDFQQIDEKLDFIACNFPAKLEANGLKSFISQSSNHLNKKGVLAIVVVKELSEDLEKIISEFNLEKEKIKISFKEKKSSYSIFHISFSQELEISEDSYSLEDNSIQLGKKVYSIKTTKALQEFDSLHFNTELILDFLQGLTFENVAIIDPGQGFSAIASTNRNSLEKLTLVSRDLLQLKISSDNLKLNKINNVEIINQDLYEGKSDLLIWSVHDENDTEIIEKIKVYRMNNRNILLAGRKVNLQRILKRLNIKIKQQSEKGKYLCVLI
ncbi:putative S-adenosylmethionine-dependent methyltransferase [uncultured archaeon]|nr:putative S-adenosylmethionine-dependent methyltransferase [uncultured archaeon]